MAKSATADLNKGCPKDEFLFRNIDMLIDANVGHLIVSFMDSFSDYNHIKMGPLDVKKTVF